MRKFTLTDNNVDEELRFAVDFFEKTAGPSFSEFIGYKIESPDFNTGVMKFEMKDRLVGNPYYKVLHGGIISSVLDTVGGHTVYLNLYRKIKDKSIEKQYESLSKIGTIDLRIDFLRPGRGKSFMAKGYMLRAGTKVAVTRMELHNDEGLLIAVGTGVYSVG